MDPLARLAQSLGRALRNADRARSRAARAGSIAEGHERQLLDAPPARRSIHESAIRVHRNTEEVQRSVAALYDRLVQGIVSAASGSAVSAAATMFDAAVRRIPVGQLAFLSVGSARWPDLVFASDADAQAVHDLERVLGEGPAHDCMSTGALRVAGAELSRRWVLYGPELGPFGVDSVAAVPLGTDVAPVGGLVVLSAGAGSAGETLSRLRGFSEATLDLALRECTAVDGDGGPRFSDLDGRAVVHQAAGMLSTQRRCAIADAYALMHAHAFAESVRLDAVARRILDGEFVVEW